MDTRDEEVENPFGRIVQSEEDERTWKLIQTIGNGEGLRWENSSPAHVLQWLNESAQRLSRKSMQIVFRKVPRSQIESTLWDIGIAGRVGKLMGVLQEAELGRELGEAHKARATIQNLRNGIQNTENRCKVLRIAKIMTSIASGIYSLDDQLDSCTLGKVQPRKDANGHEWLIAIQTVQRYPICENLLQAVFEHGDGPVNEVERAFNEEVFLVEQDFETSQTSSIEARVHFFGCVLMIAALQRRFEHASQYLMPSQLNQAVLQFSRESGVPSTKTRACFLLWLLEQEDKKFSHVAVRELSKLNISESILLDQVNSFFVMLSLFQRGYFDMFEEYTATVGHEVVPDNGRELQLFIKGIVQGFNWSDDSWKRHWNYLVFLQRQWVVKDEYPVFQHVLREVWSCPSLTNAQRSEILFRTALSSDEIKTTVRVLKELAEKNDSIACRFLFTFYILHDDPVSAKSLLKIGEWDHGEEEEQLVKSQLEKCIPTYLDIENPVHARVVQNIGKLQLSAPPVQSPSEESIPSSFSAAPTVQKSKPIPVSQRSPSYVPPVSSPTASSVGSFKPQREQHRHQNLESGKGVVQSFFTQSDTSLPPSSTPARSNIGKPTVSTPVYQPMVQRKRGALPMPKLRVTAAKTSQPSIADRKRAADSSPSQLAIDEIPQLKKTPLPFDTESSSRLVSPSRSSQRNPMSLSFASPSREVEDTTRKEVGESSISTRYKRLQIHSRQAESDRVPFGITSRD